MTSTLIPTLVGDATLLGVQQVRNALRANTAFSIVTGLAVAVSSAWLDAQLDGVPTLLVTAIGLGVVGFAFVVLAVSVAGARTVWRGGRLVAVADILWVLASIPLVVLADFSLAGAIVVSCVAFGVLVLGVAEVVALVRLSPFATGLDDSRMETVRRSVEFDAPAPIGWQVVSDHELYGRLAPNLSAVHVVSDSEIGQRRCVARSGDSWTESCVTFPEDRRYEVVVDTSDYPYPLASMAAVFRVEEIDEHRSRAVSVFRYERRSSFRGALLAAAMPPAFALIMRRITHGWAAEVDRISRTTPTPATPFG